MSFADADADAVVVDVVDAVVADAAAAAAAAAASPRNSHIRRRFCYPSNRSGHQHKTCR